MKKYDLNDESYSIYLEGLCLSGLPIEFYGQSIRQLTTKEVILMGEEEFNNLITPFSLSKEVLLENPNADIFILDLFVLDQFRDCLEHLIKALRLFFNTENIKIWNNDNHLELIVNDELFIDGFKFEELRKIVLKMNNTRELTKDDLKKNEKKEELKFKDDRLKEQWQKFMEARRKRNESEENKKKLRYIKVMNVYNFISNYDKIDYKMPLELTIYQLYNSYNDCHMKDNYIYTMRIATSGMVNSKDLDLTPLSQRIVK